LDFRFAHKSDGSRHLTVHVFAQIADDELLALRGVFTHVEGEDIAHGLAFLELDGVEAHVRADHEFELAGRDFPEALEPGDFGVLVEGLDRLLLVGSI
jgi:hypothetical protein